MKDLKNGNGRIDRKPAPAEIVGVAEEPARIIGEAVGRLSATLADALPRLADLQGKRLLRQLMAVVKSEMDFSDK